MEGEGPDWHSTAHDGSGFNQWVVDDTQSQLRMRLASSQARSQLNLGHLIDQVDTGAQRGSYRGQGFELRSDAWGVVRGAEGVLISSTARPVAGASVTSTQMDAHEAVAQLKGAQQLAQTMGNTAAQQQALHSAEAFQAKTDFISIIDPADQGKHPGSVNGQDAFKSQADSRENDSAQPVEKFAKAAVLMESPTNINWASAASTVLYAGENLHWTTQGDSRCDIDVLRKMLDENGDGITNRSEAENRLKNTEVQRAMRGMVCKFPTEWQRSGIAERWNWLTQEGPNMETSAAPSLKDSTYLSQADFPEFQRHVEALAFWDDASLGADIGSVHWHFHPVKFFQHFRKCGWLSSKELHQILSAAPKQGRARAEAIRIASNKVLRKYLIATSPLRCSHFLAQVGHETVWWQFRSESGLDRYFRTMYEVITPEEAATDFRKGKAQSLQLVRKGETEQEYAKRRPEAVLKKAEGLHNGAANAKVGGRAGDGVLFKGRGFLQITGRKNYTSYSIYRGQDFTTPPNPELVASDDYNACDVSGFYWSRENVNKEASSGSDRNHVTRVGGKINRGRADRVPLHDNERWEAFTSIWRKMNDTP